MSLQRQSITLSTGLAIFSMLFGAGNLLYPLRVGVESGPLNLIGMLGFLTTAVCLPIAGLLAMILFDGDYKNFFYRLGKTPGSIIIFLCMLIIGPGLALPRIVTLSHVMIAPFLPSTLSQITLSSSFIFALLFLGITFLCTYKENRIIDLLGYIISPTLLLALITIIAKGLWSTNTMTQATYDNYATFMTNLIRGYETLDLLGTLFFASLILTMLKDKTSQETVLDTKQLAKIAMKAGMIGGACLAAIYTGMSFLGVYYGHAIGSVNPGQLFSIISFTIVGSHGAAIIGLAVLLACLSTSIALSAVLAEYLQKEFCNGTISYITALTTVLLATIPLSTAGLDKVLALTGGPITFIGYPVLICITFCNIAYKLYGFQPIRIPVIITFVLMIISYLQ